MRWAVDVLLALALAMLIASLLWMRPARRASEVVRPVGLQLVWKHEGCWVTALGRAPWVDESNEEGPEAEWICAV